MTMPEAQEVPPLPSVPEAVSLVSRTFGQQVSDDDAASLIAAYTRTRRAMPHLLVRGRIPSFTDWMAQVANGKRSP